VSFSSTFDKQLFWANMFAHKNYKAKTLPRGKLLKALLYEKLSNILLTKLTTGVNFINLLLAAFAPIILSQKVTKPKRNLRKTLQFAFVQKMHS